MKGWLPSYHGGSSASVLGLYCTAAMPQVEDANKWSEQKEVCISVYTTIAYTNTCVAAFGVYKNKEGELLSTPYLHLVHKREVYPMFTPFMDSEPFEIPKTDCACAKILQRQRILSAWISGLLTMFTNYGNSCCTG